MWLLLFLGTTTTTGFLVPPPLTSGTTRLNVLDRQQREVILEDPSKPLETMNREVVTRVNFEDETEESTPATGENNGVGQAMDAMFSGIFGLLHLFDESGVEDASKNLRVLWARALLDYAGEMDDKIAYELLPRWSRGLTRSPALKPLARFGEFVSSRTTFIDDALRKFQANGGRKVVVLGAGFDTRALRFPDLDIIEVDNLKVASSKKRLVERYYEDRGSSRPGSLTFVGADLNDGAEILEAKIRELAPSEFFSSSREKESDRVLCVIEAVLFYLSPEAKRSVVQDHVLGGSLYDGVVMTDSLKPLLSSPFKHDAVAFFDKHNFKVADHSSRWGGAVHFVSAAQNKVPDLLTSPSPTAIEQKKNEVSVSYFPMASVGAARNWRSPSFEDTWYAVAFSKQVDEMEFDRALGGRKPYATRLWDEPIVLFRDAETKSIVCLVDACPHRAAPLSMGRVDPESGHLTCWYHGWQFGKEGERKDQKCSKSQAKAYAATEKDGLVYVWRSANQEANGLDADLSLLPSEVKANDVVKEEGPSSTKSATHHLVDTVLDYEVNYDYVIENNLDSYHLFYLHDGSVPALASLGMTRDNCPRLKVQRFKDDVGVGHVGKLRGASRPNKLIRFDAPNVVRHGGVSGFHETFHIVPIGPRRCRVLLRQYLPKGPILQTLLDIPGVQFAIDTLVKNWNYHIALEDYSCLVGQNHVVQDLGAPRMNQPGIGDDLVAHFIAWQKQAISNDGAVPYFQRWAAPASSSSSSSSSSDSTRSPPLASYQRVNQGAEPSSSPNSGASRGGTSAAYGIRESFTEVHPALSYPPANPAAYRGIWSAHSAVWRLFGLKPNDHTDVNTKGPSRI